MTHERTLELLDEYLSGELAPREERDVRRHLMACDECRAEEQALRALLDAAAALPEDIQPARDLWTEIAPRLDPRTGDDGEGGMEVRTIGPRTPRPLPWWMLAAAAVALVLATSLLTLRFGGRGNGDTLASGPSGQGTTTGTTQGAAFAAFRPAEREYQTAIGELQTALEQKRDELAPETVETLERNLEVIDRAIAESRAALAADPSSPQLARMLTDAYDAKVSVLRQAVQL